MGRRGGRMHKKAPCNRKNSYESMQRRISKAQSEEELEFLSDLVDCLVDAEMLTAHQYRELDHQLDERLCELVREGLV